MNKAAQELQFYAPLALDEESQSSELGFELWDIEIETHKYPQAIFFKCVCKSVNPLAILRATPEQIKESVSNGYTWNLLEKSWDQVNDWYLKALAQYSERGYFIEYVRITNPRKQEMVFCFNKYEIKPGTQYNLFDIDE